MGQVAQLLTFVERLKRVNSTNTFQPLCELPGLFTYLAKYYSNSTQSSLLN